MYILGHGSNLVFHDITWDRVCECENGIQDEQHVLCECAKTESERRKFGVEEGASNVGEMMKLMDVHELVSFVHNCMKHFK